MSSKNEATILCMQSRGVVILKELIKSKQQLERVEGYDQLLTEIKSILQKGLTKAYQAVDNIRVQTYWQVGERIVREELKRKDRADYGKQIVKRLAVDIGILERNIYFMYQFYKAYPILNAVRSELSWTHYRILISLKSQKEREFYEIQTIKNSWSTRELEHRVKTNEYEKAKREGKLEVSLPPQLPSPEEAFKDTYDWTFLDLEKDHTERELEEGLMQHIETVLLGVGLFGLLGLNVGGALPTREADKVDEAAKQKVMGSFQVSRAGIFWI